MIGEDRFNTCLVNSSSFKPYNPNPILMALVSLMSSFTNEEEAICMHRFS